MRRKSDSVKITTSKLSSWVGIFRVPFNRGHSLSVLYLPRQTIDKLLKKTEVLWAPFSPAKTPANISRTRRVLIFAVLFLTAFGVRLLHWQDNRPLFPKVFIGMVRQYRDNAQLLLKGDWKAFVAGPAPPADANILTYPPGYPLLSAAIFKLFGESDSVLRFAQVCGDSLAAVIIFFLAWELFPAGVAIIAGMLTAFSPQLSYYSLLLIPDSPTAVPILLAIYCLVLAYNRPRMLTVVLAGLFLGLACWLRANALMLAPFLAVVILILFQPGKRLRFAAALVCTTILVIAPITIRNGLVFGHFIPLSLTAGVAFTIGIADYDKANRFDMPRSDIETVRMEAQRYNRPDYLLSLFGGDGIARERARMARGLSVVRAHPVWFAGVLLRRGASMLRLERVHLVSRAPGVMHSLEVAQSWPAVWSSSAPDFSTQSGTARTTISPSEDGQALTILSDGLGVEDLILSQPIAVEKNTEYIFNIPVKVVTGNMVIGVTDRDQSEMYGSTPVLNPLESLTPNDPTLEVFQIPFASRNSESVRIIMRNSGSRPVPTVARIGSAKLFRLGPASLSGTRYVRLFVRLLQSVFLTAWMLPLAVTGGILLLLAGRKKTVLILLAVPLYYMCFQSLFHTEYRYVMALQPLLFVMVAVALYSFGTVLLRLAQSVGVWLSAGKLAFR
jgi:hypothetical protein